MKQKIYAMLAAAALIFGVTSCDKNDNDGVSQEMTKLTVKISAPAQTRSIEAPGTNVEATVDYTRSYVIVFNAAGTMKLGGEELTLAAAGAGQLLEGSYPSNSTVYIVANIPTANSDALTGALSFSALQEVLGEITSQADYTKVALANNTGQPVALTNIVPGSGGAPGTATAAIAISPLISRMELHQIMGGDNNGGITRITGFTVTGVYVDDYHPQFKFYGIYGGTQYHQLQSTDFSLLIGFMKNEGSWEAVSSVAAPASPNVWAYNVPSGDLPRFIIRLENVKYEILATGAEVVLTGETFYLTVTGYTGVTEFERGKIYRIGGSAGILFSTDDLGDTPNPSNVNITVTVTVDPWEVVDLAPIL